MPKKLKTAIVGAVIALVVGFAVSYGLISQQTADEIKSKTDEALTQEDAAQSAPDPTATSPAEPAQQAPNSPSGEPPQAPEQDQAPAE
ncbi:hypothetical protein L598_000300000970 [Mesorhizobium sp. J18]|uniref:hypothetical protein n=1 Tax=Mesorhizobium sp. J18 TaxID=935263 RepID=UPI00119C0E85|nr:hypothetical protein [Mesorhizobium sp. J18]TWG95493.1 hypothetical protein L598_000300000970 [Mesorhizobium sp. J18]